MKIYDLSQPLNQDCSFWPFYPPFEVKYIKRKAEHGVNAQYIMTSNHMGTHLDAPRHFVTHGRTIDQIPVEWMWGPGVIVDVSDICDDLALFTPKDLEARADIRDGDILFIHTGWHKYSFLSPEGDEERYIQRHPGPHFSICDWLLKKKIHIWGVDMISTDHPMNLPIGRFLGRGGLEHWQKVRAKSEAKFGKKNMATLFPDSAYQLTHNALFPHDCMHVENLGGDISRPELHNKRITLGAFPWNFKGGEAAFCRAVAWLDEDAKPARRAAKSKP
ncbi:MAG: cyclase family protein, partial [Chloroflexi bacterium]